MPDVVDGEDDFPENFKFPHALRNVLRTGVCVCFDASERQILSSMFD